MTNGIQALFTGSVQPQTSQAGNRNDLVQSGMNVVPRWLPRNDAPNCEPERAAR